MAGARFGTFDDLMADADSEVDLIGRRLRSLILDVDPAAVEVVRLGDGAATYGLGPKKMSEGYAYIMPQQRYVNLGFYRGAGLQDADGLLEGTGKAMRHVKVRSIADTEQPGLRRLVEDAREERLRALMQ